MSRLDAHRIEASELLAARRGESLRLFASQKQAISAF
jgi:ABC-type Fe2+-enterobactin transport system substrate-binding protein